MEKCYPELFKPFKIGKVDSRALRPMLTIGWFEEQSVFSDKMIDYYTERAKGGVGAVFTCGNVPDAHLERCPFTISPFAKPERFVEQCGKLADSLHKYGAKLFVQVWFGLGRVAFSEFMQDQPVAVSEGAQPLEAGSHLPRHDHGGNLRPHRLRRRGRKADIQGRGRRRGHQRRIRRLHGRPIHHRRLQPSHRRVWRQHGQAAACPD